MKKSLIVAAIALCVAAAASAQKAGPVADRIVLKARADLPSALRDAASGESDLLLQGLDGAAFRDIPPAEKAALDVYRAGSGSWSLMLNPVPNKAPYTVVSRDGQAQFNPLAIRDVRYALNWLIDRRKVVDEILAGEGEPMFTPVPPDQAGSDRYDLLTSRLGMSARGNEKKALADIEAAMEAASALPDNAGRLVKADQAWLYDGKPVTVSVLIRSDDPTGLMALGYYVADQLEKAGIAVERREVDRSEAERLAHATDPADYRWGVCVEGDEGVPRQAFWDSTIGRMYAPYCGRMAGGAIETFWNYRNEKIDTLVRKCGNGWFLTTDEYWGDNLQAVELGMEDAARVFVASPARYFVANKLRFNSRMLYGIGDGLNAWSLRSADVKPVSNEKVLRATLLSGRGGLFASAWDPVGVGGFSDAPSAIIEACSDMSTIQAPGGASISPFRARWDQRQSTTKIAFGARTSADGQAEATIQGLIAVPKGALIYDSGEGKWVTGRDYSIAGGKGGYVRAAGIRSASQTTSIYVYGRWHSGPYVTIADLMYALAFQYDWATKDGPGDKNYDAAYAAQYQPILARLRGLVLNKDGSFTCYYDYNWPMDPARVAAAGVLSPKAGNPGRGTLVSWEITEALAKLVTEGSKSGTAYGFSSSPSRTEVDLIDPKCVADIRAKLDDFITRKYVPASIRQWTNLDQAVARYRAAMDFIDKYHNAYISNGPYFVSKVEAGSLELSAFRDISYPYKSDYWQSAFRAQMSRIDDLKAPDSASRGKDLSIDLSVSALSYPDDESRPADSKAKVFLYLQGADGSERRFSASYQGAGSFRVLIPAWILSSLKAGDYALVAVSQLGKSDPPSVSRAPVELY